MSKRAYISRYMLLIKKLEKKPYSTYEELRSYLEHNVHFMKNTDEELEVGDSIRTLQRDFKEIRNLFGINIEYSRRHKGYFLETPADESHGFARMMEAFELFNTLNAGNEFTRVMYPERTRPRGTENLYEVLHAIQNRFRLRVVHQKFFEEEKERILHPYALREFKNRWYVIARDEGDDKVKSFALDRITDTDLIKQKKFSIPAGFNVEAMYEHCYGIVSSQDQKPVQVVLSFTAYQGEFVRTLPLHHSQQIITDTKDEFRIQLQVVITHDFVMELLSYGDAVKVIKPARLIKELTGIYSNALKLYED